MNETDDPTLTRLPTPTKLANLQPAQKKRLLERGRRADPVPDARIAENAHQIVSDVAERGDAALLEHTKRLDGVTPRPHMLHKEDFEAASTQIAAPLMVALERAARNLRTFAEKTRGPQHIEVEVENGLQITEHVTPLARVGAYAPGGRAVYPSSVLMTVVPARAAGVREVIVATPPGPDGRPPAPVLAACKVAGATACLVAGGAQAIGALAYGTETVPRVDKIVGPGNPWVTAAKRLVYGRVDTDAPAGPSEVIVLADESADPKWVALDLVAQSEHGPDSPCLLVTPSPKLAEEVARVLPQTIKEADRADTIRSALSDHGAILVSRGMAEAIAFINEYAPEHLEVITRDPERVADQIHTAGTTFIGPWAPVPAGDYLTGANHVLPTGGAGRWSGPLGVHDFLVRRTRQNLDRQAARSLIEDLDIIAMAEGLPAHGDAMRIRTREPQPLEPGQDTKGKRAGEGPAP